MHRTSPSAGTGPPGPPPEPKPAPPPGPPSGPGRADDLLDIDGLAKRLNVGRSWVRDKVTAREIPFTKIGRHVRFTEDHVRAIIAAGEETTAAPPTRLQVVRRPATRAKGRAA